MLFKMSGVAEMYVINYMIFQDNKICEKLYFPADDELLIIYILVIPYTTCNASYIKLMRMHVTSKWS